MPAIAPILAFVCWTRRVDYYDDAPPVVTYTYASWGRRIASAIIDALVLGIITLPLVLPSLNRALDVPDPADVRFTGSEVRTLLIVGIVTQVVYFTGLHAWRGATIGKMAMRTMLVRDDGSRASPAVAFTRAVALLGINFVSGFMFSVPAVVNMLRPLWSTRHQTFHDQIAKTVVVLREGDTEATGD
jgi:uncharacterized RDD family membrane protein YckC